MAHDGFGAVDPFGVEQLRDLGRGAQMCAVKQIVMRNVHRAGQMSATNKMSMKPCTPAMRGLTSGIGDDLSNVDNENGR
jgi:hypothetical protein